MANTLTRGFQLVKQSYAVLKANKSLAWFPVISSITTLVAIAIIAIPTYILLGDIENQYIQYAGVFVIYLITSFIVIYFNSGLVICAGLYFDGGNPTFKDGIHGANKHLGRILEWALFAATIGLILKFISDKSNSVATMIFSFLAGVAWSIATFFIVPVLVYHDLGVIDSVKYSAKLFSQTWGENFVSSISMGIIFLLLGIIGIPIILLALVYTTTTITIAVVVLVIIYWIILGITSASMNTIFVAALYRFAITGEVPHAYSQELMEHAFRSKKKK